MTATPVAPPTGAPPPSPAPRRLATPSWLDLRLVLGVVLVLAAVLLGATVVSRAGDTAPVVAVTHDLSTGTRLRAADLRVVQVQLDDRARYLGDSSRAVGRTLARPVSSGELLPAAAIGRSPARTTLTVPLAAGSAPDLHTGQRIELWLSTPACAFVVLLPEVAVQSVRASDDSFTGGAGRGQSVVIDVEPRLVSRVVAAQSIRDAQLRAGVLTGDAPSAAASTPSSPSTPSAPGPPSASGATGSLPADLAGCAGGGAGTDTGATGAR